MLPYFISNLTIVKNSRGRAQPNITKLNQSATDESLAVAFATFHGVHIICWRQTKPKLVPVHKPFTTPTDNKKTKLCSIRPDVHVDFNESYFLKLFMKCVVSLPVRLFRKLKTWCGIRSELGTEATTVSQLQIWTQIYNTNYQIYMSEFLCWSAK